MAILKSDIINGAYSQIRVSGLTVQPSAEDNALALDRLESMAAEWKERGYCTGYKFTESPDTGDPSGVPLAHRYAFETALAVRLLADFGKQAPRSLLFNHQQSFSGLANSVLTVDSTDYPARMPRGSGSTLRYNRWQHFYRPADEAPVSCDTNRMWVGEVNDFTEDYTAYLSDLEEISTTVIEADDGLVVTASSLNTDKTILSYTIRADGSADGLDEHLRLKITMTTDAGRIEIRFVDFQITDEDVG